MTFVDAFFGGGYQVNGADFGTAYRVVSANGLSPDVFRFNAQLRVATMAPASLNASSIYITITGQISGYQGDPGDGSPCVVDFKGAYTANDK